MGSLKSEGLEEELDALRSRGWYALGDDCGHLDGLLGWADGF